MSLQPSEDTAVRPGPDSLAATLHDGLVAPVAEAPPSRAERTGRWVYQAFRALPLFGRPDEAVLNPGPAAAHTVRPVAVPLGGATIPARWLAPKAGTGAAVLLVHGATTEALAPYMFYIQGLLERGIGVLAIELDGHGDNPRAFHPHGVADNVPAALETLLALPEVDPRRVGILGVSLGAACALHAAARRDDVRTVAAVSLPLTVSVGWREQLGELLGLFSPHVAPIALKMAPDRLLSFLVRPMRVLHEGRVVRRHILEPETPRLIDAAIRHLEPLRNLERLERMPLLVLAGGWDHVAPVRHARLVHEAAPGPARLAIARGRNHFTIMTCPFAARTLADWFENHLVLESLPAKEARA